MSSTDVTVYRLMRKKRRRKKRRSVSGLFLFFLNYKCVVSDFPIILFFFWSSSCRLCRCLLDLFFLLIRMF